MIEAPLAPPSVSDLYDEVDLYDRVMAPKHINAEVAYWGRLAAEFGSSVLELASGSGRVSLPLARQGLDVTGLDLSPSMVSKARAKAAEEGLRATFHVGDFRSFDLRSTFDLVILPYNSLAHAYTFQDQKRLLARVKEHLQPGGAFALDIGNPQHFELNGHEDMYVVGNITLASGARAKVFESFDYDSVAQIQHRTLYVRSDGSERRLTLKTRLFFPQELELLLLSSGFDIVARFGAYDGAPFESRSQHQLLVCMKAQGPTGVVLRV